jgi:hypothetical protein
MQAGIIWHSRVNRRTYTASRESRDAIIMPTFRLNVKTKPEPNPTPLQ